MASCSLKKCDNEVYLESTECILHCSKKDNMWSDSESKNVKYFWQTIRAYMLEASAKDDMGMHPTYQFLNIIFPVFEVMNRFDKSDKEIYTITETVNFWNCNDTGEIEVKFDRSILFSQCTFQYDANFKYVTFQGDAVFIDTICEEDFTCVNTKFWDETRFSGTDNIMNGKVDFSGAVFEKKTEFMMMSFYKDVYFDHIIFKERTLFYCLDFYKQKTSFEKNTWGQETVFSMCNFDEVVFNDIKPLPDIDNLRFRKCQFNDFEMINRTTINELTFNEKCIFNKNATFSLTNVNTFNFENCTIEGLMLIKSEEQSKPMKYKNFIINNCVLQSELIFNLTHAIIGKLEILNVINLSKSFDFNIIKVKYIFEAHNTDFKNTHFNNMDFEEAYKLNFYNISVHSTEFNNVNWGKISKDRIISKLDEESVVNTTKRNIYTQLKSAHERLGNKIDANKFYALEMQEAKTELETLAKLDDEKLSSRKHDYWILLFHQIFSNFSQSAVLPIFWIFMISMGMAVFSLHDDVPNKAILVIYPLLTGMLIILAFISSEVRNTLISSSKIKIFIALVSFIVYWLISIDTMPNKEFLYPLNQMAIQINPFKLFKLDTNELQMSTLVAKIFFVYLTYQFIIAVKQNTKR